SFPLAQPIASPQLRRVAVTVARPGATARYVAVAVPQPAPGTHPGCGLTCAAPSARRTVESELPWKFQYVLDRTIRIRCPPRTRNSWPLSLSFAVTSAVAAPVAVAAGPDDPPAGAGVAGEPPQAVTASASTETASASRNIA